MISRIEVRRYRCLEHVEVDLPQFAILVGANGAGKSIFLDIPRLFSDCLHQRDITLAFTQKKQERPARCNNLRELMFCGRGNDFSFAVEAKLPEHIIESISMNASSKVAIGDTIRYELRMEIFNERSIQVKNEYLYIYSSDDNEKFHPRGGSGIYGEQAHSKWRVSIAREYGRDAKLRPETKNVRSRDVKVEPSMLALPRIVFESKDDFPATIWFHDLIAQQYMFYQPDLSLLQAATPPGAAELLQSDAQNLPQLALILQKDEKRFSLWQDHIKTALPNIEQIRVMEREEDHHCYFCVKYQSGYEVTSSGLSEGTLRILALTILPYLNVLPNIVFLEEPENGIHPQAIEAVLQSLSSAYDSQILVSSHSPIVLANGNLEQVICSRLNKDGAATIIPGYDHPQLKEWKGRVDLGALFAAGVLG
jgi:predicted ATPase